MKNIFKKVVLGFSLALAAVTFVKAQTVDPTNPYAFEKKAYKPDGTPWVGPVNVGDIIKYVLSYKPGAAPSGPVTIDDTLSPNLSYVAPTVGPGWTWGSAPYSVGNHETYSSTGFGPETGSVKVKISGPPIPKSGSGDGTIPVPVPSVGKVFGVYHHAAAIIDCWNLADLSKCGGTKSGGTGLLTPLTPQSVVRGSKFFFPAYRSGGTATFGCFDAASNSACPDTPVSAVVTDYGQIGGVVEDGSGRLFLAVKDKVFCMTESAGVLSPCPSWPINSVTTSVTPSGAGNDVYLLAEFSSSPTKIYIHHGNAVIQCIDTTSGIPCAGWTSAGYKIPLKSKGTMLASLPASGSSGDGGVCLWEFLGNLAGCVSSNGAALSTSNPVSLSPITPISSFRIPNTGRVLFPDYENDGPECFDYSGTTGTVCPNFPIVWPVPYSSAGSSGYQSNGSQYGFSLDPLDPLNCVLVLGHENMLWRLDHKKGQVGCGVTKVTTPPIDQLYCNGAPDTAKFQWSSIKILTTGAAGTLTITKGTNAPVTVVVVSGTTNYAMPAAIGTGYDQLTFSFTPSGSSPAAIEFEVGYTSDKNPEICYQAKVEKCGPVFNDAVLKGSYNGGLVNVPKKVDLGQASGPNCPPPPPAKSCLDGKADVTCGKIPGTYNIIIHPNGVGGVIPTSVTITPITPGITLSPAQLNYPVVGGQVQVTVVGAHLGDVLEFDVSGTTAGGGSVQGSDLCCNGKIKIEIPKDLPCKDLTPVDLAIKKTGGTSPAPDVPDYAFHLAITNEGPAYTAAIGMLTVTDVVPAGMKFTTVTPPAGWSCSPNTNVPAGTTITCHNTVAMNLPAGPAAALGTINIAAVALGPMPFPDFTNCADVGLDAGSGATDTLPPNNHSCVTVSKNPKKTHVEIEKTCEPAKLGFGGGVVAPKWEAICHIKVSTMGVITQPINISESFNGSGSVNYVSSPDPWACSPLLSTMPAPLNCTLPANTLTGPTNVSIIDVKVIFPNIPPIKPITNCASGTYNNHSIDSSCAQIVTPQESALKVVKICDPVTEVVGAINHFEAKCHITVTSTGAQSGTIIISEAMTGGTVISATAPAPWNCTTANCNINGSALNQAASTTVIDVVVQLGQGQTSARNCARLSQTNANPIESCVDIVTNPKNPDLKITKSGLKDCKDNTPCPFTVTITSIGQPYNGNVLLYDVLTPNNLWPVTSIVPNVCGASIPTMPFGCVANLNLAADTPFSFVVTLNPVTPGPLEQNENCISVATVGSNVPTGPMSLPDLQNLAHAQGTGRPTQSCWPFTSTGDPKTGTLTIVKNAIDYFGKHITTVNFPAKVTCGSVITPIIVADGVPYVQTGIPLGTNCSVVEQFTNPPTGACPQGQNTGWVTTYNPTTPVVITATGATITITNKVVCEGAVPRDMYVKKVVVNNAPLPLTGMVYDITSTCTNTTQPTGFAHFVDGQTTIFHHYEAGMSCTLSESIPATTACGKDTPVWTTTYSPAQTVALTSAGETVTVTNTLNCIAVKLPPVVITTPKPPVLNCDERTTKLVNDTCRCIIQGQTPISQTACGCPKGTELQKGQCVKPKPVCPQGTRFNDGRNRCEPICRDGQEYNPGRNLCLTPKPVCRQGTHYNPATNFCVVDKPVCKRGQKYDAATNRCINVRPVCEPGTQYNPKRNTCVPIEQRCPPGTLKVRGLCVEIPRCRFPQIPIPGTGICVNPFGGGGRPPPRTDGGAVPGL